MKILRTVFLAASVLAVLACWHQSSSLRVKEIANPTYPSIAQTRNIQGKVDVDIGIGPDGRVLWAKASSGPYLLREGAVENVKKWVFGPFPPHCAFPIYHTVTYDFELRGKPVAVMYEPSIETFLPDRVVLVTHPFVNDFVVKPEPSSGPAVGTTPSRKPKAK